MGMRRRSLLTLVAVIMVVAARSVPAAPSAADESAVFEQLTRGDWCDAGCRAGGAVINATCSKARFLRSGTLRRWAFGDVPEGDQTGPWNFSLESRSGGSIRLGGTSILHFQLRGDTLVLGDQTLVRCRRPPAIVDDTTRGRDALPAVAEPALLHALCAHDWMRVDDFHPDQYPDRWHCDSTLTFAAQFRGGACRQSGRFSIDDSLLLIDQPGPTCGGLIARPFEGVRPKVEARNDTLILDGRFHVAPDAKTDTRLAILPNYPVGLRLVLRYEGELKAGVPKQLSLRFICEPHDDDHAPYRLRALRASMQTLRPVDGGLGYDGPSVLVARRAYPDRPLAHGESFADTVTIVPPRKAQDVELLFEWDGQDSQGGPTRLLGRGRGLLPVR